MQQSLALLQAPNLELKTLVTQQLSMNPLLEEVASTEVELTEKANKDDDLAMTLDPTEPPKDVLYDPATEKPTNAPVDELDAEWKKLAQFDTEWRDTYGQSGGNLRSTDEDEERRQFMFDSLTSSASLHDVIMEQVRQSDMTPKQLEIADLIVGNIDDHGYLKTPPEEIALNNQKPIDEVNQVLRVIQTFQPAGVGARSHRECLMLQLERKEKQDTLEYQILDRYWDALCKRRLPEIAKGLACQIDEIQDAEEVIRSLDLYPGRAYTPDTNHFVIPEVFVSKVGNEYVVTTNNDQVPQIRISRVYKDMMARAETSPKDREWIREKMREGKFFINSLYQRQKTITNIAKEIVHRQRTFMEHGVSHLVPMTMVQVADVVKVHETTVSRAVNGKYMQTPQGIFEMKYFFTSAIPTASGGSMSNTSVKEIIAEIFSTENRATPLSDQAVVQMLASREIVLARRTVAKYREELNIPPSSRRKVY